MNLKSLLFAAVALAVVGAFSGCGGGSGGGGSGSGAKPTVAQQVVNNPVSDQYNFPGKKCETHWHYFTANSQEELERMYCAALQDEVANNNGCAKELRDKIFADRCIAKKPKSDASGNVTVYRPQLPSMAKDEGDDDSVSRDMAPPIPSPSPGSN